METTATTQIKTIDIQAKEWFHKAAANSYFSAIVTVNYGEEGQQTFKLPFQYGYDNHYIDMAGRELVKAGLIAKNELTPLWRYCDENGIKLHANKQEGCKEREVKNFVK